MKNDVIFRFAMFGLAAAMAFPVSVLAQVHGIEVAGGGGGAILSDFGGSSPSTTEGTAHASIAYNAGEYFSLGFEYAYVNGGTTSTSSVVVGHTLTTTTATQFNTYGGVFRVGPVNPKLVGYDVSFAGGGLSESYQSVSNGGGYLSNTSQSCTCSGLYVAIGGGFTLRAGRFGVRPEVRLRYFQPTQSLNGTNYAAEATADVFYVIGGKR